MSALWAPADNRKPADAPAGSPTRPGAQRPRLRAVAAPPQRLARFPFLLALIGIFGVGMVGLLMLNTTLQGQAFEARTLSRQATELAYTQADLENQLDRVGGPDEVARRASQLGMRPNPRPAFLVLPSGEVVGQPEKVKGTEAEALVTFTDAELAARQIAREERAAAKLAEKQAKEQAVAAAEAAREAAERKAEAQREAAAAAKKKADRR